MARPPLKAEQQGWARLAQLDAEEQQLQPGNNGYAAASSSSNAHSSSPAYHAHPPAHHTHPPADPTLPRRAPPFDPRSVIDLPFLPEQSRLQQQAIKTEGYYSYTGPPTSSLPPSSDAYPPSDIKPYQLKSDPGFGQDDEYSTDFPDELLDKIDPDAIVVKAEVKPKVESTLPLRPRPLVPKDSKQEAKSESVKDSSGQSVRDEGKVVQSIKTEDGWEVVEPGPGARIIHKGIELVPRSRVGSDELEKVFTIPPVYIDYGDDKQAVFEVFNCVQSKAFESDENLVVSAPTGSGKTTIFDLALLRMLQQQGDGSKPYAIYLAPTKALCAERKYDWEARFSTAFKFDCAEVTGDTQNAFAIMKAIENSDLIVTTVHFLRDSRGATLETVISRLKAHGPSTRFVALSATVPNIHDIARWLVPLPEVEEDDQNQHSANSDGTTVDRKPPKHVPVKEMPEARVHTFGESFRPVTLEKRVIAYRAPHEWALQHRLNNEIGPLVIKHAKEKPVLVFCATRKACQKVAMEIAKQSTSLLGPEELAWKEATDNARRLRLTEPEKPKDTWPEKLALNDANLQGLVRHRVAFHHAGLDASDRKKIEQNYIDGKIRVIVSTSTLAVGVNLPAHTVIIMGTQAWHGPGKGFKEYSDIDIQQMMGRAGRPQFDKSGLCIIMCEKSQERRYNDLVNSKTLVESALYDNLTEHLNTEIGLGTITSLASAQRWLRGSFLFIRIQQNPSKYAGSLSRQRKRTWEESLNDHVKNAVDKLVAEGLVEWTRGSDPKVNDSDDSDELSDEASSVASADYEKVPKTVKLTPYGALMSEHVISFRTMIRIMKMSPAASIRAQLEMLSGASEFQDIRIRPGETQVLKKLAIDPDIRYPMLEQPETYADKVFLHLQACLANLDPDDDPAQPKHSDVASFKMTQMAIYKDAPRIAKVIASVAWRKQYGWAYRNALIICRAVIGKAWEDSAAVFRQIEAIGPKSIGKLAHNGITTFDQLSQTPIDRIEALLNRTHLKGDPFGKKVHKMIDALPRYRVTLEREEVGKEPGTCPVLTLRVNVEPRTDWKEARVAVKTRFGAKSGDDIKKDRYNLTILIIRSDGFYIDARTISAWDFNEKMSSYTVDCKLDLPHRWIEVYAGVNELAGCNTTEIYKPQLEEEMFEDIIDSAGPTPEPTPPRVETKRPIKLDSPSHKHAVKQKIGEVSKKSKKTGQVEVDIERLSPSPVKREHSKPKKAADSEADKRHKASQAQDEYRIAIADIAKPRGSRRDSGRQPTSSTVTRPKTKAIAKSKAAKEEPLFLPTSSSQRNLYIDDEAIESDDEGEDEYNTDDAAFIDDSPIEPESHKRKSRKRPSTAEPTHDEVSDVAEQDDQTDNIANPDDGDMVDETSPQPIKESQRSPSDDFDGIEFVDAVLDEDGAFLPSPSPGSGSMRGADCPPISPDLEPALPQGNSQDHFEQMPGAESHAHEAEATDFAMPYDDETAVPYENELAVPYENQVTAPYENALAVSYENEVTVPYENEIAQDPLQPLQPGDYGTSDARELKRERRKARKAAKRQARAKAQADIEQERRFDRSGGDARQQSVVVDFEVAELKVRTGDCYSDYDEDDAYVGDPEFDHLVELAQATQEAPICQNRHVPDEVDYSGEVDQSHIEAYQQNEPEYEEYAYPESPPRSPNGQTYQHDQEESAHVQQGFYDDAGPELPPDVHPQDDTEQYQYDDDHAMAHGYTAQPRYGSIDGYVEEPHYAMSPAGDAGSHDNRAQYPHYTSDNTRYEDQTFEYDVPETPRSMSFTPPPQQAQQADPDMQWQAEQYENDAALMDRADDWSRSIYEYDGDDYDYDWREDR